MCFHPFLLSCTCLHASSSWHRVHCHLCCCVKRKGVGIRCPWKVSHQFGGQLCTCVFYIFIENNDYPFFCHVHCCSQKLSFVQGAGIQLLSIVIFLQGWLFLITQVFCCCKFICQTLCCWVRGVRIEIHQMFFFCVQILLWSMIVIKQLKFKLTIKTDAVCCEV